MKRKKNTSFGKKVAIISVFLIFVIIVALGVYQNRAQPRQPKSAAEYFEIFDATVNDGEFRDPPVLEGGGYNTSRILIIYDVEFQLKAKGGDANSVIVKAWGKVEPQIFDSIPKNQWVDVHFQAARPLGYLSEKVDGKGFPLEIETRSEEAEGTITIYL